MFNFGIFLCILGAALIVFPELISYIIGGTLLFFGIALVLANLTYKKTAKKKTGFSFGKYELFYKNKK